MKPWYGTNLKMYKTNTDVKAYLTGLMEEAKRFDDGALNLFVMPPYTALEAAGRLLKDSPIILGAQNMAYEAEGQFTGEISAAMLKDVGVAMVMIGHSERRHVMGETDDELNKKVLLALENGFKVLLCIGETKAQKAFDVSDDLMRLQLKIGLHGVKEEALSNVLIAYEPVWAIGTEGIPAEPPYVQARHQQIKATLCDLFGQKGKDIPVFYGGSVNPGNATAMISCKDVDGLFVGRSAWNAKAFGDLIEDTLAD